MGEQSAEKDRSEREAALARLITESIAGRRWRDLTPLDVAKHLVASGVVVPPVTKGGGDRD